MLKNILVVLCFTTLTTSIVCMENKIHNNKNGYQGEELYREEEVYSENDADLFLGYLDAYIEGGDEKAVIGHLESEPKLVGENLSIILEKVSKAGLKNSVQYIVKNYIISDEDQVTSTVNLRKWRAKQQQTVRAQSTYRVNYPLNQEESPKLTRNKKRGFNLDLKSVLAIAIGSTVVLCSFELLRQNYINQAQKRSGK